jgi:hypothetical protein
MSLHNNASQPFLGPNANVLAGNNEFVDRRNATTTNQQQSERRQFGSSHSDLSPAGRELAVAIDEYKIEHHRRYLTCDEMISVITRLGYQKTVN